jgi:sugar phosphate isomerase/epimerase
VHFADSNRQAAGAGQTRFEPIVRQLKAQGYAGYLSAEVFPMPDSLTAARLTIERFRELTSNP